MVLYAEKSWSSLVLVPASGEAFSGSGSESRMYSSSGSLSGIERRFSVRRVHRSIMFCVRLHGEASDLSYATIAVVQVIARFTPQHRDSKSQRPLRTFYFITSL